MRTNEPAKPQMQLPLDTQPQSSATSDWKTKVPSVSQLTRRIRGHLENSFFDVWVRGEVSNFRKPVSGHGYFVLKDSSAQLKGVMFRGQLSRVKFKLEDGMEILAHGSISVYEARGEYQILCDKLEPVGVGALQLAFEQLKQKLQKEGVFDSIHKKPLPVLPKRIGVVTSATGAAVRDIIKVITRRFPEREIIVIPANVQGEKAAGEIAKGIVNAHRWNESHPNRAIDVLIVGRGGGSLEDLWPFNEEIVAREIFNSKIPIVSAVGHEIDFTIADFVADVRAPTPSAAAEIVLPKKEELAYKIEMLGDRLLNSLKKSIQQIRLHLGHLSQRLVDPREKLRILRSDFKAMRSRLITQIQHNQKLARNQLVAMTQMLDSLSPLKVVSRGYSITQTSRGKIILSVREIKKGAKLVTRLKDGQVHSEVTQIK